MYRNPVIDNLKGLGISLVILGHLQITEELFKVIYSVHMPVFFFVSGFLFKAEDNFRNFFKKKYLAIVKPFLTFALLTFVLHRAFSVITDNKNFSTVEDFFISIIFGNASNGHLSWNPPLWFLPCLFTLLILFYFIEKNKNKKIKVLFITLFFSIGVLLTSFNIYIPWGITNSLLALPFLGFDFLFRKTGSLEKILLYDIKFWIIPLILFGVSLACNYGFLNFAVHKFGNLFLSYLAGFLGILILIKASSFISSQQFEFLGKNSLFIFGFHIFLNALVKRGLTILNPNLPADITAILILLIVLVLFYLSIKYLRKSQKLKKLLFIH
ncbi:acyltransferase family protein [Salinimicrobium soli]|uniref:acyltransferase family protein n=1 Tax=Salinimicrobium soli TaxID=1254399 RepID=UPI003AB0E4DC